MKKLIKYLLTEIENLKSEMTSKTNSIINLEYEVSSLEDVLARKNARISELEAQVTEFTPPKKFGDLEAFRELKEAILRDKEEDIFLKLMLI